MEHPELRQTLLADEPAVDLDALLARTRDAVEADSGPVGSVRRWSTARRVALVLAAAGATTAFTLLAAPRPDLGSLPPLHSALTLGGTLAVALFAVALAMRPSWRPEASPALARGALVLAVLGPLALMILPEPEPHFHLTDPAIWRAATLGCFVYTSAMAGAVVAVWRLVERRSRVGALRWATALAGACAVGTLAVQLHCPVTELTHLLLGHGLTGLVWATLGGLVVALSGR